MNTVLVNSITESSVAAVPVSVSFNKAIVPPKQEKEPYLQSHSLPSYCPLNGMFGHKLVDLQAIWTDLLLTQESEPVAAATVPYWTTASSFSLGEHATLWGNTEFSWSEYNEAKPSFSNYPNRCSLLLETTSFSDINKAATIMTTPSSVDEESFQTFGESESLAVFRALDLPKFVMNVYHGYFHDHDNVSVLEMDENFIEEDVEEIEEEQYVEEVDDERDAAEVDWLEEDDKFALPFEEIFIVSLEFDDTISAFDNDTWTSDKN